MTKIASRAASVLSAFLMLHPSIQFIPGPVTQSNLRRYVQCSAVVDEDRGFDQKSESDFDVWSPPPRPKRHQESPGGFGAGTSWVEKNRKFTSAFQPKEVGSGKQFRNPTGKRQTNRGESGGQPVKNFREDFRGTRVFVQGIPSQTSWRELKDHFQQAGEVVFASISTDSLTGEPRGHGIVQFETTEMAQYAIAEMRNFPLDGATLYVRADVQERGGRALQNVMPGGDRDPTQPTKWRCADEDILEVMDQTEYNQIRSLIKRRDDARRRREYDTSDQIREGLKANHMVHLDDRLKLWWMSEGGKSVPQAVRDIKGEGRWGRSKPWRQIPTTPENDACVNPDLVERLLKQRDIARREKDFQAADELLEKARTSPDGDLNLRIHDESRTWRIWTDAPPPRKGDRSPRQESNQRRNDGPFFALGGSDSGKTGQSVSNQCIAFIEKVAPDKVPEVQKLLRQFPGREFAIYEKVKQRFGE